MDVGGGNYWGELGDGTNEDKNTPVKIMENVKNVNLGGACNGAITEDGNLWMWGWNSRGELGDGTNNHRNTPVKVMENVKEISLGDHNGAIKEDGSLWMWGDNDFGQLGNGTTVDSMHPINITDQFNQTQQLTTDEPAANIALQSTPQRHLSKT